MPEKAPLVVNYPTEWKMKTAIAVLRKFFEEPWTVVIDGGHQDDDGRMNPERFIIKISTVDLAFTYESKNFAVKIEQKATAPGMVELSVPVFEYRENFSWKVSHTSSEVRIEFKSDTDLLKFGAEMGSALNDLFYKMHASGLR